MKALVILLALILSSCANNDTELSESDDCGIPELTGVSCIEPNYAELAKHPFGISGYNPVRADGASGQREYLSRLICPDGRAVKSYSRAGSVGVGPYGFMLDLYSIECRDKSYPVYMDLYHKGHIENTPIDGFTIKH